MRLRLPGMKDAMRTVKKIGQTQGRIIGWLLHNANSSPPMIGRKEFYAMKERILIRHGTPGSPEFQHFKKKDCFHCWSHHHCWDCDDYGKCCRCDGTGIYLPEVWVRLIPWALGGFRFHCPAEKHYELPEGHTTKYEGKIIHDPKPYLLPEECRMWLELFFNTRRFFQTLGSQAFYDKLTIKRPLTSLGTIVRLFRFDRWRLLRVALPHRVYWRLYHRHKHEIPF
jgi:hypothetical protein